MPITGWMQLGMWLATLVFMAGGFCWLAFNHFKTVTTRLDAMDRKFDGVVSDVAWLKGRESVREERL